MFGPHIWDAWTVPGLNVLGTGCVAKGKTATIMGLNDDSNPRQQPVAGPLDTPPSEHV